MECFSGNNTRKVDFMVWVCSTIAVFYSLGPLIVGGLWQEVKNGLFVSKEG